MKLISQNIFKLIFPFLKLRDEDLTWYKRASIYGEVVLMVVMLVWLLFFITYNHWFTSHYMYKNLNFYTYNQDLNQSQIDHLMQKVNKKIDKHDINISSLKADIYFTNSNYLYNGKMVPGTYFMQKGPVHTYFHSIYFKYANVEENSIYLEDIIDKAYMHDTLSQVLAHELVHVWQNKVYGLKLLLIPRWIIEGYAVYVSEEKSDRLKNIKSKTILQETFKLNGKKVDEYLVWYLMLKHAIEKMHKSVDELHEGKVDYDEVLNSLLKEYNVTKEEK